MKHITLTILAILFLTSCSDKLGIQKRRYNKGYYIASSHKKHNTTASPENKHLSPSVLNNKTSELITPSNITSQEALTVNARQPEIDTKDIKVSKPTQAVTCPKKENVTASSGNTPIIQKSQLKNIASELAKTSPKKSSDSDVKLIILVLLAIFLPPLAVFLKNESVNTWFWVTLILCLLTFSIFFFFYGGALWLAAIVIALLYVLDAIS